MKRLKSNLKVKISKIMAMLCCVGYMYFINMQTASNPRCVKGKWVCLLKQRIDRTPSSSFCMCSRSRYARRGRIEI